MERREVLHDTVGKSLFITQFLVNYIQPVLKRKDVIAFTLFCVTTIAGCP
jgi:hypothetical protein